MSLEALIFISLMASVPLIRWLVLMLTPVENRLLHRRGFEVKLNAGDRPVTQDKKD